MNRQKMTNTISGKLIKMLKSILLIKKSSVRKSLRIYHNWAIGRFAPIRFVRRKPLHARTVWITFASNPSTGRFLKWSCHIHLLLGKDLWMLLKVVSWRHSSEEAFAAGFIILLNLHIYILYNNLNQISFFNNFDMFSYLHWRVYLNIYRLCHAGPTVI